MKDQHRVHLLATYDTLCKYVADMRAAAVEGRSPSGMGPPLMPMSEARNAELMGCLERLLQAAEKAAQRYCAEELRGRRRQGPAATRMWVSILLRTLEDVVRDLAPEHLEGKFGALSAQERSFFSALVSQMRLEIEHAKRLVG